MAKDDRTHDDGDAYRELHRKLKEKSQVERQAKAERKQFKRNQKPKGNRRKDWTPTTESTETEDNGFEPESFERIMPRDESDRRRALEHAVRAHSEQLAMGTNTTDEITPIQDDTLQQGMVVAIANAICRVLIGEETLLCNVRGLLHAQETGFTNALAVGDQVLVRRESHDSGVVEKVLPRRSLLARPDVFHPHLQQIVLANADQLLVVASWRDPVIWFELIDRYLVAAARYNLPAAICINKIDLANSHAECEQDMLPYRALGIPYLLTSAQSGEGIDQLRTFLQGRTTVLAGLSGVGKSSLLSAVQPGLNLRVGVVSEHSGEGRHTTTQATMLRLDEQTWVVDTPGIRRFGLSGLTRPQLIAYFPEIEEAAQNCRFRNCTHNNEPGCAVQSEVANGLIAPSRFHSYQLIYESLPAKET